MLRRKSVGLLLMSKGAPKAYAFLEKALEQKKYDEALEIAQQINEKYPNDKTVYELLLYLRRQVLAAPDNTPPTPEELKEAETYDAFADTSDSEEDEDDYDDDE